MTRRVLIANRGEIALRIMRTCHALGLETVAVFSDADADAPYVRAADAAVHIGPSAATESYLSIPRILAAARESRADAVHPGYGFLSEHAAFAAACRDEGLTFVGPSPDVIARTGSKIACRQLAESTGVPVIPGGVPDDQTLHGLEQAANAVGYPILLKPSAGGGGKGMRVAERPADLPDAVATAQREAEAAFGDRTLYIERHLSHPRHVEVQVVGDRHGGAIHLCERECSIQRRYQKVVEETPAVGLLPILRAQILDAAVAVAVAAKYDNVGTVEFLVDGTGQDARYYFLEMNTRLQVEHPVTELSTGIDLVQTQLEVADGRPLPWQQSDIVPRGHSIECRIYAEDPTTDYLPQAGSVRLYREPTGPGIRVDSGIEQGSRVPVHYDPLLAKLVAHGATREAARMRALEALRRFVILGFPTNVAFLSRILAHPRFVEGRATTTFLADEHQALTSPANGSLDETTTRLATIAAAAAAETTTAARRPGEISRVDPWTTLTGWR